MTNLLKTKSQNARNAPARKQNTTTDARRLRHLVAIGPLHAPQLRPDLDEEVHDTAALAGLLALLRSGAGLRSRRGSWRRLLAGRLAFAAPRSLSGRVESSVAVASSFLGLLAHAAICSSSSPASSDSAAWITASSAGLVGCCLAVRAAASTSAAALAAWLCASAGFGHQSGPSARASAFPCAGCDGHTSGRTCASRSDPDRCAGSCLSGSCGACTLRKRESPRFELLRVPFLRRAGAARW